MSLWHDRGCSFRGKRCLFTSVNLNKRAYWGWSSKQAGSSLLVVHVVITCGKIYHSVGGCIQFFFICPSMCALGKSVNVTLWNIMLTNNCRWDADTHTCPGPPVLSAHCCPFSTPPLQLRCSPLALAHFCTMRTNTGIHLLTLRCVNWHGTDISHPLCKWCRWRRHLGSGCELWHTHFQTAQHSTCTLLSLLSYFCIWESTTTSSNSSLHPMFYISIFFCAREVWLQQLSSLVQSALISLLSAGWAVAYSFGTA